VEILLNYFGRCLSGERDMARQLTSDLVEDGAWRVGWGRYTILFHVEQFGLPSDVDFVHVDSSATIRHLFHVEQIISPKRKVRNWLVAGLHLSSAEINRPA
jgi:hypothetical protein